MTEQDFDYVRNLLKERCAIVLEPGKEYLIETRLTPLVHQLNLSSIEELLEQTRTPSGNRLSTRIVEAMVNTETSFFRDHNAFESLKKVVLPDLIKRRASERSLVIWSAACSTGQEPYSIAIAIRENFPELAGWNVSILASDISSEVLARAMQGRYHQNEINRGMPASFLVKHFEQQGTTWQLKPDVRSMVKFRELNLVVPWPLLPRIDLVLLRNVMIYFDVETKKTILGRVAKVLRPGGFLLLGGSETTINLDASYRRVDQMKAGYYQLPE